MALWVVNYLSSPDAVCADCGLLLDAIDVRNAEPGYEHECFDKHNLPPMTDNQRVDRARAKGWLQPLEGGVVEDNNPAH